MIVVSEPRIENDVCIEYIVLRVYTGIVRALREVLMMGLLDDSPLLEGPLGNFTTEHGIG
jgi:hypothetical protein